MKGARFCAIYRLTGTRKEAFLRAKDICYEQTVEFPDELILSPFIRRNVVGRVESFKKSGLHYVAEISYPVEAAAGELTQFLNVIFGNISLKGGIRLESLELPVDFLERFEGPRFGVTGLRKTLCVARRPLLCTALKPMGLSSLGLAQLAYKFALGGIDIIKDDHGLTNQYWAPFKERVSRCAEAVRQANKETGFNCVYAAHVTAPIFEIEKRALFAKKAGAGILMVAPGIAGFDLMRALAGDPKIGLPIFSHPAFAGSFVIGLNSGISHYCFLGQLNRLSGADAVIFPNYGGRFSFTPKECDGIMRACADKMGSVRAIFPCPGGGMGLDRVRQMCDFYGRDVIFLIGGALLQGDLASNCRRFRNEVIQSFA